MFQSCSKKWLVSNNGSHKRNIANIGLSAVLAMATLCATQGLGASSGQASGVNSAVVQVVPTSESQNVNLDETSSNGDPNFTTHIQVLVTTAETVVSALKEDKVADTGPVLTGVKEASVISPKSANLSAGSINLGDLSLSGVHSKVTIGVGTVDAVSQVGNIKVVLRDLTGLELLHISAVGLKASASASSQGKSGGVAVETLFIKYNFHELGQNNGPGQTHNGVIPPSLSGKKIGIEGGYVIFDEQEITPSGIKVNAVRIFMHDAATGTDVNVTIGSASASL
jgi:hypothetical protein